MMVERIMLKYSKLEQCGELNIKMNNASIIAKEKHVEEQYKEIEIMERKHDTVILHTEVNLATEL